MHKGRIFAEVDELEWRIAGSATYTDDGYGMAWPQWSAANYAAAINDTVSLMSPLSIIAGSAKKPSGDEWFRVKWTLSGSVYQYEESTWHTSMDDAVLRLKGVTAYNRGGDLEVKYTSAEALLGGSVVHTWGGGSFISTGVSPCHLRPAGIPCIVRATPGWTMILQPYPGNTKVSVSGTGGYRMVDHDGNPHAYPVVCDPRSCPDAGSASPGTISVTDSWTATVTAYDHQQVTTSPDSVDRGGYAQVILVPSVDQGVVKLGTSYGAMVERLSAPGYKSDVATLDRHAVATHSKTTEYAAVSAFLEEVGDSAGSCEDVFGADSISPYSLGAYEEFTPYLGGDPDPSDTYSNTSQSLFPAETIAAASSNYLTFPGAGDSDYITMVVNYLNTRPNLAWLFFLFYPPDGLPSGSGVAWKVDSAVQDPSTYWLPLRQQFGKNPGLPSGGTKRRYLVVSEPLANSGNAGFIAATAYGQTSSWWGVSRFQALELDLPSSLELSTHAAWSVDPVQGSLSFDSGGVTVTPTGATCRVSCALHGSLSGLGYYNALADKIALAAFLSGSGTMEAFLVDACGHRVSLGTITGTADHSKPRSVPKKYAGTWAEDWGQGEVTDEGHDARAGGLSSSFASSVEGALLPLASARQYVAVQLDLSGLSGAVKIPYPLLKRLAFTTGNRVVHADNGARQFVCQKSASAFRWGHWTGWDGTNILSWPNVAERVEAPSALDGIGFKRWLKGLDLTTGLDTEIRGYYVFGEEFTQDKHLASDPINHQQLTNAFLLPESTGKLFVAILNGYSECPPFAQLPNPKRNLSWAPTISEGWSNKVYSWCERLRKIGEPDEAADSSVNDAGGSALSSSSASSVTGWRVYSVDPKPLDGTEDGYTLRADDKRWARELRPWHGYVWTGPGTGGSQGVALTTGLDGAHHELVWMAGLNHLRNDWGAPFSLASFNLLSDADSAAVVQSFRDEARLHYTYVQNGTAYRAWSDDDGQTLNDHEQISGDSETVLHSCPLKIHDGAELELYSVYEPGDASVTIKVKRYNLDGSVDGPWTVGGMSPVLFEPSTFGARSDDEEQKAVLSAFKSGEDAPTRFISDDDGETWTAV